MIVATNAAASADTGSGNLQLEFGAGLTALVEAHARTRRHSAHEYGWRAARRLQLAARARERAPAPPEQPLQVTS